MTRVGLIVLPVLFTAACTTHHPDRPVMLTHQYSYAEPVTPLAQDIDPPRCETFLANMALAEKKTASTYPIHAL
jgi:hypothetical protein